MANTLGSLSRRPLSCCGHTSCARRRVVVEFGFERSHVGIGLGEEAFEPVAAAIAGGTCRSSNPDAILGNRGKGHEAIGQERRDALCQESVQNVGMLDPKGGQSVVVDTDPAGEPAVCVVLGTQSVERSGRADAFEGRIQPQRHKNPGVNGWPSRMPFHRLDPCIERAQIEALREGPNEASSMVGAKEAIEIDRAKFELAPVRELEPRCPCRLLALVWLNGRKIEEAVVHAENRSCDANRLGIPSAERFTSS